MLQLLVWCKWTCQNGPNFCLWGDVTATTKSKRTLQIIQTDVSQLCDKNMTLNICSVYNITMIRLLFLHINHDWSLAPLCVRSCGTFIIILVFLSDVLQVLGEIRLGGWRTGEEPGHQVEQLPAKGTAGSVPAKITKRHWNLDCYGLLTSG